MTTAPDVAKARMERPPYATGVFSNRETQERG